MISPKFSCVVISGALLLSACQTTTGLPGVSALQREQPRDVYNLVRGHIQSGHWDKKKLHQHAHCNDERFWKRDQGGALQTVAEIEEYYDIKGWNFEENYLPPIMAELLTTGDVEDFHDRATAYCFYKKAR